MRTETFIWVHEDRRENHLLAIRKQTRQPTNSAKEIHNYLANYFTKGGQARSAGRTSRLERAQTKW